MNLCLLDWKKIDSKELLFNVSSSPFLENMWKIMFIMFNGSATIHSSNINHFISTISNNLYLQFNSHKIERVVFFLSVYLIFWAKIGQKNMSYCHKLKSYWGKKIKHFILNFTRLKDWKSIRVRFIIDSSHLKRFDLGFGQKVFE